MESEGRAAVKRSHAKATERVTRRHPPPRAATNARNEQSTPTHAIDPPLRIPRGRRRPGHRQARSPRRAEEASPSEQVSVAGLVDFVPVQEEIPKVFHSLWIMGLGRRTAAAHLRRRRTSCATRTGRSYGRTRVVPLSGSWSPSAPVDRAPMLALTEPPVGLVPRQRETARGQAARSRARRSRARTAAAAPGAAGVQVGLRRHRGRSLGGPLPGLLPARERRGPKLHRHYGCLDPRRPRVATAARRSAGSRRPSGGGG
ncbi:UNVERIFIED_ORG: hypothetical protein CLV66_13517 [Actinomadura viridilutea]